MKKLLLGLSLFMSLMVYGKEEIKYDHYRKMDKTWNKRDNDGYDDTLEEKHFYKFKQVEFSDDNPQPSYIPYSVYWIDDKEWFGGWYYEVWPISHEVTNDNELYVLYSHNREFDEDVKDPQNNIIYAKGTVMKFEQKNYVEIRNNEKVVDKMDYYVGENKVSQGAYNDAIYDSHEVE